MEYVQLEHIDKSFGEHPILKDFNHTFKVNEITAIVGPSGSGKSTLLNIIGLLEHPSNGKLLFDGYGEVRIHSKSTIKILRHEIAYLFQNYALIDNETVYKNIAISLEYVKTADKKKIILDALKSVGLKETYLTQRVYSLSGGEQQRVALARVICKPSSIILADEPTGNLDEKNSKEVFQILKTLSRENKCVILVTHDVSLAKQCDHIIELK